MTKSRKDGTPRIGPEHWRGRADVHEEAAEQLAWLATRSLEALAAIRRGEGPPDWLEPGPSEAVRARARAEAAHTSGDVIEPLDELLCLVASIHGLVRSHRDSAAACRRLAIKATKRGRPSVEPDPWLAWLAARQAPAAPQRGVARDREIYRAVEREMARLKAAGRPAGVSAAIRELERSYARAMGVNSATAKNHFRGWRAAHCRGRGPMLKVVQKSADLSE